MPTLVELAGTALPPGHVIDGHSIVPILRGEKTDVREWIFSYLGDRRVLRTKRWLLENNAPYNYGTLYDCGQSRNGTGYKDVTHSTAPEVLRIKKKFEQILADKPVPNIPKSARQKKKTKTPKKHRDK